MNNLDDIYKEFGKEFCLCPFVAAFYTTNRTVPAGESANNMVLPCSLVPPTPNFEVTNNSIIESVNSDTWKKIRQHFVNGEFTQIKECQICIKNEQQGGASARHGSNKHFVDHISEDLIQTVQNIIDNDYQVEKILSFDYFPTNYCNYSCIMCAGGASSGRLTFEIQHRNSSTRTQINPVDSDFYNIVRQANVINFTGGETILQPQVLELIDYLIQEDLAKNIRIFLLTNASSFPSKLEENFLKFKRVIYMCSIDGIGPVIEYQRRGAVWATVESNTLKLVHHNFISTVINYVLTAVNALSFMEFADWVFDNHVEFLSISPVTRFTQLSVAAMPAELRELTLHRLFEGQKKYKDGDSKIHRTVQEIIEQIITIINNNPHRPELLPMFVEHIRKEDLVSKRTLAEVVPEWAPYFKVDH